MRRLALILFLLALASAFSAAKDEPVEVLKSRFETARIDDRPTLAIQIAQHQLRNADKFYIDGKIIEARQAVDEIVTYAEHARDAAMTSQKHLKNVEIDVRKISERLRDIRRTLAFEDQAPVEKAIRRLEDIRTALLKEMFGKDDKHKKEKQ
jgi:uncharacterized membrane protein